MITGFPLHIIRIIGLLFLQVVAFNHINIFGYANPFVYILGILLLPSNIPTILLMLIAFCCGFMVDLFNSTLGMHMATAVCIAFIRKFLLVLVSSKKSENELKISLSEIDTQWFNTYLIFSLGIYHLIYFLIEMGGFSNLFYTLLKTILSTALALLFTWILLFLFGKNKNARY